MASETIYGYFGKKGAGKTHELTRVILDRLREGRYVVAVIPQLDVDKVASYLKDPTVKERLIVKDYTDIEEDENFFPDEHLLRKLQMWKRGDPVPADAHKWRNSVVIPGSFLVIDEAWRWLESKKTIPPRLKAALHMARHWQGPMFWNDPEQVAKYKDPAWFPMMGGPPFEISKTAPQIFPEQWQQLEDGTWRRELGGDGTPLCTANILFASQDFFGLDRSLRAQIDQCTQLVSIRDSYFPTLLKKATDGKEQYMAYTFEAADMPTRRQMLAALNKGEKLWLTEDCVTHDSAIHELKGYAAGYAKENRVDDKSDLSKNPHWKKIKRQFVTIGLMFAVAVGGGLWALSRMQSPEELAAASAGTAAPSGGVAGTSRPSAPASSIQGVSSAPAPAQLGFAGKVGKVIVLEAAGVHAMVSVDAAQLEHGGFHSVQIDGRTIHSEVDLAAPHVRDVHGAGNRSGVVASGSGGVSGTAADAARAISERAEPSGYAQGSH